MYRLIATLVLLSLWAPFMPVPAIAQGATDEAIAANVAVELSALEASGDFNSLYDRIHPDAHAIIPRVAVIGWFQNEFAPLGPGVSTITGVRFVEWTWPVTGQTYPYTAEVSFVQAFADGSFAEDVVRLVQDQNGEWRWFFGRSREFVDEQIAQYGQQAPAAKQGESIIDVVITDLNTYWTVSFEAADRPYATPNVVPLSTSYNSACGLLDFNISPAYYCALDQSIYFFPEWFIYFDFAIGDFAWITIMAHEWGHHVQALDGQFVGRDNGFELQADCLAGSYARDAATRGLLEPGDVTEAVAISSTAGDPAGLPQDVPGAHGTSDDRVIAFMRGYLDGFLGCDFMSSEGRTTSTRSRQTTSEPDLVTLLPLQNEVPSDLQHSGDRNRSLTDVAANYIDPEETERLFTSWGWEGNVTRSYEGNSGSSGVTSVYVSIHRFSSAQNAERALDYSLEDQAASTGAQEVSVAPLATTTRALATSSEATIYAQQGDVVIRLTITAPNGNPMSTAEAIMEMIVARAG